MRTCKTQPLTVKQTGMTAEEGASYGEQLLESARRNNTELLLTIKSGFANDNAKLAELINSTNEVISNNSALHLACASGNWEVIDIILDIEGVEIDPVNREGDTPLHLAVKYANDEPEHGLFVVDGLLDAGADPRIRNKTNLKPVSLVSTNPDEHLVKLKELLQSSEYAIDAEIPAAEQAGAADEDDDEALASDSDE